MKLKELKEAFLLPNNTDKEDIKIIRRLNLLKKMDKEKFEEQLWHLNTVRKSEGLEPIKADEIKGKFGVMNILADDNIDKLHFELKNDRVKEKKSLKSYVEKSSSNGFEVGDYAVYTDEKVRITKMSDNEYCTIEYIDGPLKGNLEIVKVNKLKNVDDGTSIDRKFWIMKNDSTIYKIRAIKEIPSSNKYVYEIMFSYWENTMGNDDSEEGKKGEISKDRVVDGSLNPREAFKALRKIQKRTSSTGPR